jgi:cellulose synthase/poly-beta-1,6-N-acetylglucosamine synthase-like glycosyltransferase
MPTVSVLMPVRDAAATVAATVGSVRAQTLEDGEPVVVDDGSRDETAGILRQQQREDQRIVIFLTAPRGRESNRVCNHTAGWRDGTFCLWPRPRVQPSAFLRATYTEAASNIKVKATFHSPLKPTSATLAFNRGARLG